MKIFLVSSEVIPFAKTGGLADVCGSLPVELRRLGHDVVVCMPGYQSAQTGSQPVSETGLELPVELDGREVRGRLLTSRLPDSDVPVWLVQNTELFDRPGLYQDEQGDYGDNCRRFSFFCHFALELLRVHEWFPDVLHCNDWQTGLVPALLRTRLSGQPGYRDIATLMTIHNLAYQGVFDEREMASTGMEAEYFNWRQMEFYGHINLLKTGIVFADAISTVSPQYAREIQTRERGCGLENVLRERSNRLLGVLNGVNTSVWNPGEDRYLAATYGVASWRDGKSANKAALQKEAGFEPQSDVPLIGLVGRLASQKGWSLILPVMTRWLESRAAQWIVLGTGDVAIEESLRQLRRRFPSRLAVDLGFSDALAHRIEAGADIFLMPSQYEPCGLNQQYSMRYGTVPVVHHTGGLADTVVDANPQTVSNRTANGFAFESFDEGSLESALARAVATWTGNPAVWSQLVETGMTTDWSWERSARRYQELYHWLRDV